MVARYPTLCGNALFLETAKYTAFNNTLSLSFDFI